MKHQCLEPKQGMNWQCSEEDCQCSCEKCQDYMRVLALPELTDKELDELPEMIDGATPGPWRDASYKGMGPMRFIVSESKMNQPEWFKIVAILENPGSFLGDKFIAWCRDGVPRLLKTIVKLKQENAYLRGMLKTK